MTWKIRGKLGAYGPGSYWAPEGSTILARATASAATENVIFICPDFTSDAGLGPGNVADLQPYGQTNLYVIKAVYISPDTTLTGVATNFITINVLRYNSAGVSQGTVAGLAFSSGAVVATAKARTSLGVITAAQSVLATGDVLTCQIAVSGTGQTSPQFVIAVDMV
jgi:hypothetical protein